MIFFNTENRNKNAETKRVYAAFELVYTLVDFFAAACFVVGSILFFYDSLQTIGTWFFLIGSILFAAKPTLRLVRETKLIGMGDYKDVAEKLDD